MHRPVSLVLVAIAGLGLLVMLIVFAREYGSTPATVATHFGASGQPNAWGPKSTLVIFPVIGVVMFGIATVIALFDLPAGRSPVPPVLPVLASLVFAEVIWMLVFAEMSTFDVALGRASGLSPMFFVGLGAVMLTAVSVVIIALISAARTTRG